MFWGKKKKILLIEDDNDLSEMYKMRFIANNFEVRTAPDGQKGLEELKKFIPDLALLDIVMPKKDGFDLLEEVQNSDNEELKKVPIIILSNLASPIDVMEGKRLGARDWWIKSFNTPTQITQKVVEFFKEKTKENKE